MHHVERLRLIVNALQSRGHSVEYLTADNYLNIDPNSAHLVKSGLAFKHISAYLPPNDLAREMTEKLLNSVGEIENYVDPYHLSGSVPEACEAVTGFHGYLLKEKPDLVLGLHENNFWYRILAYKCTQFKIPAVAFQEGLLRLRDETTQGKQSIAADYSTKLLCWSDAARDSYIRAGIPESKLAVTGISHLDAYLQPFNREQMAYNLGFDPRRKVVSFLLPQTSRYEGNWQTHLQALAEWASMNGVQLAVKFHPFESEGLVESVERGMRSLKIVKADTLDLVRASSLVISQHSTVAIETVALGVPLVELDLDNHGILESLAEQGVAVSVRKGEAGKLADILSGKIAIAPAKLSAWRERNVGPLDGKSTERVCEELEKLL